MEFGIILGGFGGGAVRGLVGFLKHQYSYKDVKFKPAYFFGTTAVSGIVGAIVANAVSSSGLLFLSIAPLTPALALVIGYAGGDFLENIYKILIRKR